MRHETEVARLRAQRTGYHWIAAISVSSIAVASLVLLLLALAIAVAPSIGQSGAFAISGVLGLAIAAVGFGVLLRSRD